MLKISIITIALAIPSMSTAGANEKHNLHCQCKLTSGQCQGDEIGKYKGSKLDWYQDIFVDPNKPPTQNMLNISCWRKSTADGYGNGLCCTSPESEADMWFRGDIAD